MIRVYITPLTQHRWNSALVCIASACVCVFPMFVCAYVCSGRLSGENCLADLCLLALSSVITMQCQVLLVKSLVNEELELCSFHLTRWCSGTVRSLKARRCYKSWSMMLCSSQLEKKTWTKKWGILIQCLVLGCFRMPKGFSDSQLCTSSSVTWFLVSYVRPVKINEQS